MIAFVLLREDRGELGHIDTTVEGVFLEASDAEASKEAAENNSRLQGDIVEGDDSDEDDEWTVSYYVVGSKVQL